MKRKLLIKVVLVIFLLLATSGCGQLVNGSNFTLEKGETLAGSLLGLSANVWIEEESSGEGSVVLLCCNIMVEEHVQGDVLLLTGNIQITPRADVDGRSTC
jgi:hypothetical protein